MDGWISKFNDRIEFIIYNNDVMALGAVNPAAAGAIVTKAKKANTNYL